MINNKSSEKGFTLVEVIVVGILMSILALGAFSVFMMYTNATRETSANLRLQRQADAFIDKIAFETRRAAFVFAEESEITDAMLNAKATEGDDFDKLIPIPILDPEGNVVDKKQQIIICNAKCDDTSRTIVHFKGDGSVQIQEKGSTNHFTVGGVPMWVDFDNSKFELRPDRRQVRIDMVIVTEDVAKGTAKDDQNFTLKIQRGSFRCRN